MKKFLLLLMILASSVVSAYAQKENNIWVMGYHAGLDFNSGTPVAITTSISSINSSASVCDDSGRILFYTNGDSVWDKNGHAMPNGYDLINPHSAIQSNQGALIVPLINNPKQFYVFSHETCGGFIFGDMAAGRLYYSVVDMSLNSGLGDIVPGKKGIALDSILADKMIAVAGNNCNIWVLTHKYNASFAGTDTNATKFEAYEITDTGLITTPVVSKTGNLANIIAYAGGELKVSPNRQKLAICSGNGYPEGKGLEIYDFSPSTGIVSNAITIDTGNSDEGVAFSPDNSKLYLSVLDGAGSSNEIYQFDISLSSTTSIIASKTLIDTTSKISSYISVLRLASNGKIYGLCGNHMYTPPIGGAGADSIFYINTPNTAGTGCGLAYDALGFNTGTGAPYSLGNDFVKPIQDTLHTHTDITLTDSVSLHVPGGYFAYSWSNNSTDTMITVHDTGTYIAYYYNYCTYHTDSFLVHKTASVKGATLNEASLLVYPSPAEDNITININNSINTINGTFRIIDDMGRTVMIKKCDNKKTLINIKYLANGIYTILYTNTDTNERLQKRFIVAK